MHVILFSDSFVLLAQFFLCFVSPCFCLESDICIINFFAANQTSVCHCGILSATVLLPSLCSEPAADVIGLALRRLLEQLESSSAPAALAF